MKRFYRLGKILRYLAVWSEPARPEAEPRPMAEGCEESQQRKKKKKKKDKFQKVPITFSFYR